MEKTRLEKIEKLFNTAVKIEAREREDFLSRACPDDPEMRRELAALLSEDEKSSDILDESVIDRGLRLLAGNKENSLTAGEMVGNYKIVSLLGAGGMGEVYLAEDLKLRRRVALKMLSSAVADNIENQHRFSQEALAASQVVHPNAAHVYEYDIIEGKHFIVMEYVRGENLRQLLKNEKLKIREILEISLQITAAVSEAHQSGVIHRDIKPENVMVNSDRHVKVLDFGLAKFVSSPDRAFSEIRETGVFKTSPGLLMGTVAYMSPEQIRGEEVDFRTDIWSFGVLLYEMLTGKAPFEGRSKADTISNILKEDLSFPDNLKQMGELELVRVIKRCVNKDPKMRFQSARDLGFTLETILKTTNLNSFSLLPAVLSGKTRRNILYFLGGAVALLAVAALFYQTAPKGDGLLAGSRVEEERLLPEYNQITFQRGTVWSARFAPGNPLVYYSATNNGEDLNVFFTKPSADPASKSLNLPGTALLSISGSGDLALLKTRQYFNQFINRGTLQRMPIGGNSLRDIAEDVQDADWFPDGENLMIVRYFKGGNRIEYPINNVLWETTGYVSNPRFSPDGKQIAFLEHPKQWDNRGYVSIVDTLGNKQTLTDEWSGIEGLAWNPQTNEIWFTASKSGESYGLYAVTTEGKARRLSSAPVNLLLHDVSKSGEVLISRAHQYTNIYASLDGETAERNLTWLYVVGISDYSSDGKSYIFTHFGEGSGSNYKVYYRDVGDAEPIHLGDGRAQSLSPDKTLALSTLNQPVQLIVLPVKAGEKQVLPRGDIEQYDRAEWFPDGRQILITGRRQGEKSSRCFIQNFSTGEIRALTPEGVTGTQISPDGKMIFVRDSDGEASLFEIGSGKSTPLKNLAPEDEVIGWSDDNQHLFIAHRLKIPIEIFKFNAASGEKKLIKVIDPQDKAGVMGQPYVFVTPDGKSFLYGLRKYMFDLFIMENLN
jgi:serine/threonine protein kinase/Tol biopolymer transport system component